MRVRALLVSAVVRARSRECRADKLFQRARRGTPSGRASILPSSFSLSLSGLSDDTRGRMRVPGKGKVGRGVQPHLFIIASALAIIARPTKNELAFRPRALYLRLTRSGVPESQKSIPVRDPNRARINNGVNDFLRRCSLAPGSAWNPRRERGQTRRRDRRFIDFSSISALDLPQIRRDLAGRTKDATTRRTG